MPEPSVPTASTLLDGKILVFGGSSDGASNYEAYDPTTNAWTILGPMPRAHRDGMAATVGGDGRVYLIGGQDGHGSLSIVDVYNPASDTWEQAAPLSTARETPSVALGADGKIRAFGGWNEVVDLVASVESYDAANDAWSVETTLADPQADVLGAAPSDGAVFVLWEDEDGTSLSPLRIGRYDLVRHVLVRSASAPAAFVEAPAGSIADGEGHVYVAGVTDATIGATAAGVARYDSVADRWGPVVPMPEVRTGETIASGQQGLIYLVGGSPVGGDSTSTVQRYDPQARSWSTLPPMREPRDSPAVAVIAR